MEIIIVGFQTLFLSCPSHYGAQAVVVSIDPKRVYVDKPEEATDKNDLHNKTVVKLWENETGPHGENYCWWQVTVKGGREARDVDAIQVAKVLCICDGSQKLESHPTHYCRFANS